MFLKYLAMTICIITNCCFCYLDYESLEGFDMEERIQNGDKRPAPEAIYRPNTHFSDQWHQMKSSNAALEEKAKTKKLTALPVSTTPKVPLPIQFIKDAYDKIKYGISGSPAPGTTNQGDVTTHDVSVDAGSSSTVPTSPQLKNATKPDELSTTPLTSTIKTTVPAVLPIVYPKFNCSENERPFNIGAYEVPTQRDLVLQIQKTLKRMFSQYREKALDFLEDIRQATKATLDIENNCIFNRHTHRKNYKNCVKKVSRKCEFITKTLVMSLERQKADVSAFIDGTICQVGEMRADPLQLIKTLAMDLANLEFFLPGFLRLLGSCSVFCHTNFHADVGLKKPIRHMTDQDLVVKHFLTKKSYKQLIKGN